MVDFNAPSYILLFDDEAIWVTQSCSSAKNSNQGPALSTTKYNT